MAEGELVVIVMYPIDEYNQRSILGGINCFVGINARWWWYCHRVAVLRRCEWNY